jgi:hypothetical protein
MAVTGSARASGEVPPEKWYVGIGFGIGGISGPDWTAQDNYYGAQGYLATGGSGIGLGSALSLYGGWRWREYLDVELGLTGIGSDHSTTYTNATGGTVWSKRQVGFSALSAAALLRPPYGYGHFLYLKLGVHNSDYGTDKTSVTGTVPNLSAIAAGDRIPTDAHYTGWGLLAGVGMDFGSGTGTWRLEYVAYGRIGGTAESAGLFAVSYHYNF